jgi:hypothetical protein
MTRFVLATKARVPSLLFFVCFSPTSTFCLHSLLLVFSITIMQGRRTSGDSDLGSVGHEWDLGLGPVDHEWEEDQFYRCCTLSTGVVNEAYAKLIVRSVRRIHLIHLSGFRPNRLTPSARLRLARPLSRRGRSPSGMVD